MSENLTNLFSEANGLESTTNSRSLAGTVQLTNMSNSIAQDILRTVEDNFETYRDLVARSKVAHDAMDQLIFTTYDFSGLNTEFLSQLDETTLELMLKSQQSKRSRSKSKAMTMDNYRSMMVGAIAENLIRLVTGKTKVASGSRHASGLVSFSEEDLQALQADQEKLRKEIRNVQSKKSILKSKEGFSEEDERWQALLVAEGQLKAIRTEVKTVAVDETKNKLSDMLADVDVNNLNGADAKKLLEQAMALIAGKEEN